MDKTPYEIMYNALHEIINIRKGCESSEREMLAQTNAIASIAIDKVNRIKQRKIEELYKDRKDLKS